MYELDDLFASEIYSEKLLRKNGNYNAAISSFESIIARFKDIIPESEQEVLSDLLFCIHEIGYQSGKTMFSVGFTMGKHYGESFNNEDKVEKYI